MSSTGDDTPERERFHAYVPNRRHGTGGSASRIGWRLPWWSSMKRAALIARST
jgi:hypothetical protein